jgi:hypothetical protein
MELGALVFGVVIVLVIGIVKLFKFEGEVLEDESIKGY